MVHKSPQVFYIHNQPKRLKLAESNLDQRQKEAFVSNAVVAATSKQSPRLLK